MFVCVMRLFICLANKCIINKPLPHVILSVYSPFASVSFHSSANELGHRAASTVIAKSKVEFDSKGTYMFLI